MDASKHQDGNHLHFVFEKKKISKTVKDKSLKISLVFLTIKMKQDLQFRDTYSTFENVWLVVSYFIDFIFVNVMRSSVIVDHFRNLLWHTWCKHFWRTSIVHFCKLQWPSPQRFSGFRSREHHFILLEDVLLALCTVASSCWKTQSLPRRRGPSVMMLLATSGYSQQLHLLERHCSTEGKSIPDQTCPLQCGA